MSHQTEQIIMHIFSLSFSGHSQIMKNDCRKFRIFKRDGNIDTATRRKPQKSYC